LELAGHLSVADPRRRLYENAAASIGASLVRNYSVQGRTPGMGLIKHGVYSKPEGRGVDESCAWGDYFYLELLARLSISWSPYW